MGCLTLLQKKVVKRIKRKLFNILLSCAQPVLYYGIRLAAKMGVTKKKRTVPVIISFTSFPTRIGKVHIMVRSLFLQTVSPDKMILWLAPEQFPNREADLPPRLLEMTKFGLSIEWYRDIRSYKKLIPALKKYPDAVIVTADDDMLYTRHWLENLYAAHLQNPHSIQSHRVTEFSYVDGRYTVRVGEVDVYPVATYLHMLAGGSGALYPPRILHADVFNEELAGELAPTSDDIWFWLMGVLNRVRVNVPLRRMLNLYYVPGTQEGPSLYQVNDMNEKLFWVHFHNILAHYPEIDVRLKEEARLFALDSSGNFAS